MLAVGVVMIDFDLISARRKQLDGEGASFVLVGGN